MAGCTAGLAEQYPPARLVPNWYEGTSSLLAWIALEGIQRCRGAPHEALEKSLRGRWTGWRWGSDRTYAGHEQQSLAGMPMAYGLGGGVTLTLTGACPILTALLSQG